MQRTLLSAGTMSVLLALLVAGCAIATPEPVAQPTPTPAPTVMAPEATEVSSAAGTQITGKVLYGGEPVPHARVELRTPGWQTKPGPAVASAEADAQGQFVLENIPAGDYTLIGIFPDGEEDSGGWPPVTIATGETITELTVPLERGLQLLEPASGAQVEASSTLRWEGFLDAARYRVWVVDAGTTELAFDQVTPDTSLVVTPPLKPGRTYNWMVNALAEDDTIRATGSSQFTVVGATEEAATPANPDLAGLPPSCQTGSDQLAVYADRLAGYCFLYPARFEVGEFGPGQPGIFGPPLDESLDPLRASLQVEVTEVPAGTDLATAVETFLHEFAAIQGLTISREPTIVASEPAEILEPIPGRLSSRDVIVLHGDRQYRLIFQPAPGEAPAAAADVQELFETVTGSFTIMVP